jgi:hypothetical protein
VVVPADVGEGYIAGVMTIKARQVPELEQENREM